jgi:mannitol-1-phosphate 5-dehydrogenase
LADPNLMAEAREALAEISQALQLEYGFSAEEMDSWVNTVIEHTNNDFVRDTTARSAADPVRKLQRDDRLLGPTRLCLKHGVEPKALLLGIGRLSLPELK